MFIRTRGLLSQIPPDTHVQVDGDLIIPGRSLKNLGIHFGNHIQFDTHINELSSKIYGTIMCSYVNRLRDNFNKNTRIYVIQSLVLSIVNYGTNIWGSTNATQLQRMQRLQNFAAKIALGGAAKHEHVTPYLKELGWLKINQKYYFELEVTIYRITDKRLPNWLFHCPQ